MSVPGPVTDAEKGTKDQPGSYSPKVYVPDADKKMCTLVSLSVKWRIKWLLHHQ